MLKNLVEGGQDRNKKCRLSRFFDSEQFTINDYMDTVHLRSMWRHQISKADSKAKIAKSGWLHRQAIEQKSLTN
jgi:hypothetical protein